MADDTAELPKVAVGVLSGTAPGERRVALVPETIRRLARGGQSVIVEAGAGTGAWYPDEAYLAAGARVAGRGDVIDQAEVLLSVSRPPDGDLRRLRAGQVIVGLLDPASDPGLFDDLAARQVTAISLERLPRTLSRAQALDVLTSQASVAGYKAVLVAATEFGRYFPLLITAAGTSRPARVLVLGAGVAGLSAIGTARRLGAVVTGYDVRPETRGEVESLGARFLELQAVGPAAGAGGYARALTTEEQKAQQEELESLLPSFDVIITTAAVPGRRPPLLVSAAALSRLHPGSVVVDMGSGPLGGNVAGSEPGRTTVTEGGVTVVGASNLPSSTATSASDAFSQNMAGVLGLIMTDGRISLDLDDAVTAAIVVTPTADVSGPPPEVPQPAPASGAASGSGPGDPGASRSTSNRGAP